MREPKQPCYQKLWTDLCADHPRRRIGVHERIGETEGKPQERIKVDTRLDVWWTPLQRRQISTSDVYCHALPFFIASTSLQLLALLKQLHSRRLC